ncbi:hypothetical protein GCM10022221_01960 [Actinocorallia aurea]
MVHERAPEMSRGPERGAVPVGLREGDELRIETLAAPDVPATVRAMLRIRLQGWRVAGEAADAIELAASELMTNACSATPSRVVAFRAVFRVRSGDLWIGAWDGSAEQPVPRRIELTLDAIDGLPEEHEFGGWGLSLVLATALETGAVRTRPGKWVYAVFGAGTR